MKFLLIVLTLSFTNLAWSGSDIGIQGRCHDGTAFQFSLEPDSCQSQIGTFYLIERAADFCKMHCSPWSGKCAIDEMNNIIVSTCTMTLPKMYRGFAVVCGDGSTHEFNTCSDEQLFADRMQKICSGKQGVESHTLKDRCN